MDKEEIIILLNELYRLRSESEDRDTYSYYDVKCYKYEQLLNTLM